MKVEYIPMKNQYISKRNMELFEDRVQPYQALGQLRTLCEMQTTDRRPGTNQTGY